jgi:membrane protease YdiL (CAAX protease family)
MPRPLPSHPALAQPPDATAAGILELVRWPLAVACASGSIAWVSVDLLRWPRELFLLPYVAAAWILGTLFVRRERVDVAAAVSRNPLRTSVITLIAAGLMITTVLLQRGAPRAHGARLVAELAWDGVAYGCVDGLLLTVIPMAAVTHARAGGRTTDAFAFVASMFVFIVYHLGFPEFRGTGLVAPVVASIVFGAAYLAARNPLAPIIAHAAMHVVAVLHGPAGTVQLPPHY